MSWLHALLRLAGRVIPAGRIITHASLLLRPMTLGVRGAVFDEAGRVLLVRHTYLTGWHLPGGGVDAGETTARAVAREIAEEAGLDEVRFGAPFAIYHNRRVSRRDHVVLYVSAPVANGRPLRAAAGEIAEVGFFDPAALPEGTTPAVRRRLEEIAGRTPPNEEW
ncbi:MAG: NUDIX domain-containing protein [Siculibacillus sp.]